MKQRAISVYIASPPVTARKAAPSTPVRRYVSAARSLPFDVSTEDR